MKGGAWRAQFGVLSIRAMRTVNIAGYFSEGRCVVQTWRSQFGVLSSE